jgi:hypothetical protein
MDGKIEKNLGLIEKLHSDNYSVWSIRMKALLQEKKIFYTLQEEKPAKPSDDKKEEEHNLKMKKWDEDDSSALNSIILTVSDPQIIHIKRASTGKEAWEILKTENQSSSMGNTIRIYKQIFRYQLPIGGSMRNHIDKFLNLFDQLAVLGTKMDEKLQVTAILTSLNNEYSSVVTGIEAWDEKRLKLSNVKSILIEEFEKKESSKTVSSSSTSSGGDLFYTKATNYHANVQCNYCKRYGHIEKNCHRKTYKYEKDSETAKLKQKIQEKARHDAAKQMRCLDNTEMETQEWYVDSGASKHICSNPYIFKFIRDTDRKVVVASGHQIKADGIGDIEITIKTQECETLNLILKDVLYFENKEFSNLLSVSKLSEQDLKIIFQNQECMLVKNNLHFKIKKTNQGL